MIDGERLLFVKQLRSKPRLKPVVINPLRFLPSLRVAVRSTNEERFLFHLVMVLHPTLHRRVIGSQSRAPFQ